MPFTNQEIGREDCLPNDHIFCVEWDNTIYQSKEKLENIQSASPLISKAEISFISTVEVGQYSVEPMPYWNLNFCLLRSL